MPWGVFDTLLLGGSLALMQWLLHRISPRRGNVPPLPPGPKGLPFLGNVLDMPREKEWVTYTKWNKEHGPVCLVEALGRRIVVISSYEALYEILIRQSKLTSDRPRSIMAYDIMGWGSVTTFLDYGDELKVHRSLFFKYMQMSVVKNYMKVQTEMTHQMLGNFLHSPARFMHHIRRATCATVMMLVYGHRVVSENDEYITLAENALRWASEGMIPGRYWIEFFPWLQYIPNWFPGTKWKEDGRAGYQAHHRMYNEPFVETKETTASANLNGSITPCIVNDFLSDSERGKYNETVMVLCAGTIYAGGAETTVSLLQSVVLALVLEPQIAKRAQEELDRVVGSDRLPTFEDKNSLPYIEGILREALRWNPVFPLDIPHETSSDVLYNGYCIPSGSMIVPNVWALLHDEQLYPEPFKFSPERWLDNEGNLLDIVRAPLHPNKVVFGFGRRICPGRHLAENSLFIGIASMIAAFNFGKAKDKNGHFVAPSVNYRSGVISEPEPFECTIMPRSQKAVELIHQALSSQ